MHNKIKKERAKFSKVYLLGADSTGIVTQAIRLRADIWAGCEFMRGIDERTMTRAYLDLIKKNCTPAGFANSLDFATLTWNQRELKPSWSKLMGGSLNSFPGMGFVIYDKKPFAITANKSRRRHLVELKVV